MRILYVDISLNGHRIGYIKAFQKLDNDAFCLIPKKTPEIKMHQFEIQSEFKKKRSFNSYRAFIFEIASLVEEHKIDTVHILCGDALYRYFGIHLDKIGCDLVITYHHMQFNFIKKISIRQLFKYSKHGVVHTASLFDTLAKIGVQNKHHIEYPMLDEISQLTVTEAKGKFGIKDADIVIGVIGGTQKYKGLDVLIKALNTINSRCTLLIAGVVREYDEQYIRRNLRNNNINLALKLRGLTDMEFADAIQASDIIVLPYKKEFDGASGPLVSGIFHKKIILASNHGSLGRLVNSFELGKTFESENACSLATILEMMLKNLPKISQKALEYADDVNVENFLKHYCNLYSKEEFL